MQRAGWDGYFRQVQADHPDWSLSALRRATNRFFAPYDQKVPPGHCTGGAVDVRLLDLAGEPLDVTSPLEGWRAAPTWVEGLSNEARANRMILVEAMLSAGFSNCRDEYWHYSYGDSAWAVRTGAAACPYGWSYPPAAIVVDPETGHAVEHAVEPARDATGRPEHFAICLVRPGSDLAADPRGAVVALREPGAAEPDKSRDPPPSSAGKAGRVGGRLRRIDIAWARDVPVALELNWAGSSRDVESASVDTSSDGSEALRIEEGDMGVPIIRITPQEDRVCVTLNFR
jgi:hypothetical protein